VNLRILSTIGAFIITFFIVYFVISGGMNAYSSRKIAYVVDEDVALKRDFGIAQAWMKKYNVSIKNEIDLKMDQDNDGLTLLEEYTYNTDPKKADTDGDGYTDGHEVKNGYSPSGDGVLDVNNNQIPDKWEIEMIGHIVDGDDDDPDNDGLTYYDEYIFCTDPKKADTDGDGYTDGHEVANGYDPVAPGNVRLTFMIAIDKIDVEAPVMLSASTDESALQKDLEKGVVHYPGTALPGQRGNAYIAGHSSNYAWSHGAYNYVFKGLNDLAPGDRITITMAFANGKKIFYNYTVSLKEEVSPDDARIFAQSRSQELTLTTCWPLGTNTRRIMIKAQLQEV
jgi:LPXTG-site transpeptidase (sortase) family protein